MQGFKIDWLEGTFKEIPFLQVLENIKRLFLDDFVELDRGGMGYSHSALVCETGRVFWSPDRPEMGVHLTLPSKALEVSEFNPLTLASDLHSEGFEFTRVDFALDDTVGMLDLTQIISSVKAGAFVSRARKWTHIENSEGGETISFGSRSSDSYIRIYDKAAEQTQAKKKFVVGHWVRVELELKRERADAAILTLLASINPDEQVKNVFGWFRSALDFKTIGTDSNKSRWQTVEWWEKFLAYCEKVRIFLSQSVRTAQQVVDWIDRQVAPSLLVAMTVLEPEGLLKLASNAVSRLKPKHIAMMQGFAA